MTSTQLKSIIMPLVSTMNSRNLTCLTKNSHFLRLMNSFHYLSCSNTSIVFQRHLALNSVYIRILFRYTTQVISTNLTKALLI